MKLAGASPAANVRSVYDIVGLVCGLGDVIAQNLIEKRRLRDYNIRRTTTMTAIGFLFTVKINLINSTIPNE